MYNFATGSGVSIGIIISGAIVLNNSWRTIYWVGALMIGVLLLLIIFTFPETSYNRAYDEVDEGDIYENKKNPYRLSLSIILDDDEKPRVARYYEENDRLADEAVLGNNSAIRRMEDRIRRLEMAVLGDKRYSPLSSGELKKSYWSKLTLFSGQTYTNESYWKMFVRPFGLILLPPVLWATLVMSTIIGFSVAISSACKSTLNAIRKALSDIFASKLPVISPEFTISHPSKQDWVSSEVWLVEFSPVSPPSRAHVATSLKLCSPRRWPSRRMGGRLLHNPKPRR
jgi:MFS family permease